MAKTVLHDVLQAGVEEGASDWHFREGKNVSIRISGNLAEIEFLSPADFLDKAIPQLMSAEKVERFHRSGDADFAFLEDGVGRFRGNLHRERGRLALSLRHVKGRVPPLADLGLPETVHTLAEGIRGIVFVTGITGSGKSTTLARMVEHMNETQQRHIITIEDPIEYSFEDRNCVIEQREIGLDTISFESALVHVLRQDPDVIVIGEMRDRTTFETALTAAETGHLVLTTLHTNNASQSIMRILDLYAQAERESVRRSLSASLNAIVCQRLIPRQDGRGQIPAVEILINTPIVAKLIYENRLDKLPNAIDGGMEDGMVSFNRSLYRLIKSGTISEKEGMDASNNPEQLRMNLSGIFLDTDKGSIISEG
ncbi:MAG: Twitching mobility protein [Lentisphaerae bacterium ADurb.BinA184]|nr:MAG: Twitching mobility protein [Lentisphaerae bacterium ADurb.BinA184]